LNVPNAGHRSCGCSEKSSATPPPLSLPSNVATKKVIEMFRATELNDFSVHHIRPNKKRKNVSHFIENLKYSGVSPEKDSQMEKNFAQEIPYSKSHS
jgi:hypothetical protein